MFRYRSSRTPLMLLLAAAVAAIAAAYAALARRGRVPALPGPLGRSQPGSEDWRCACGARYRVTGTDRHRVFWPAGAAESNPVLGTECPNCGRALPA